MHKIILLFIAIFFIQSSLFAQETKSYWPKQIKLNDDYLITVYAPEPEKFENNILNGRAAFSIYDNKSLPQFGAMWFRCRIHTDIPKNEIYFSDIEVVNASFPGANPTNIRQFQDLIAGNSGKWQFNSDLKQFYTRIGTVKNNAAVSEALNNTAPKIYYEKTPTLLVSVDGDPVLDKINGSELYSYVVNTNSFIVQSSSDKQFYLNVGSLWYTASKALGPWKPIETPPAFIQELANNANKTKARDTGSMPSGDSDAPPKLIVSYEPAELIQTDGEAEINPAFESLFVVSNSKDEIIYDADSEFYFILISGRWYKTKVLESGTWAFCEPEQLPVIFRTIPPASPLANVLLSVPGTPQSVEAALNNAIPQTAVVDRYKATMMTEYDGEPQFAAIDGVNLQYALNTGGSVLLDSTGTYYAVDQAVWFTSDSPKGPWKVAVQRPPGINQIPPNCPVFNVKFVYIYDYTPDVVFTGYTPGYTGFFLYHGVVVYGTGYRYKPWHGSMFIPGPYTFGYGAQKQSSKNNINVWVTYGYGGFYNSYYNPVFFLGAVDHPDIQRKAYDPTNIYNNRSVGIVQTITAQKNDPMHPVLPAPAPSESAPKNMYTDAEGNIFSQDDQGNWYMRQGNDWQPSKNPTE